MFVHEGIENDNNFRHSLLHIMESIHKSTPGWKSYHTERNCEEKVQKMHLHKKYSRRSTCTLYTTFQIIHTLMLLIHIRHFVRRTAIRSFLSFLLSLSPSAGFRGHPTIMILFYLLYFTTSHSGLLTCPFPFRHFVLNGFFFLLSTFWSLLFGWNENMMKNEKKKRKKQQNWGRTDW